MIGTNMSRNQQNFRSYLTRRRVASAPEVEKWFKENSITSLEKLQAFCTAALLDVNVEEYKSFFLEKTVKAETPKKASPAPTENVGNEKTWHTPAAKRPLRRGSAKKTTKKSSKTKG